MSEKLIDIREAARYLGVSEEEVKRLVDIGEVPAYKIGGTFLRFRKEQIDAIRSEISLVEETDAGRIAPPAGVAGKESHPYTDLERDIKRREPMTRQYDYTAAERLKDFLYFNDFYLVALAVVAVLMFIILK